MNIDQADPAELAALREAFGVEDSGESALGWEAVHAFEADHKIVLPEPYRTFVAEITDGSSSGPPEYGLISLAEMPADLDDGEERDLSKPFPLTEAWIWEDDEDVVEDGDERVERVYNHGSIVLGTDGCGLYWHLIVTGPHRGHIWQVGDVGASPFGDPFGCTTAEPGFTGWVRHWAANKPWHDAT
ncbi:SMI1/KNR4 family protein [Streptomyces sp. 142MFCol3.1]|uniref:SMI1/KNR4 family protein n=1 Tax=Streptomyces sp. 142MFCol3.1 TaxID=1172179 RepID=UPI0003F8AF21|nr:SMI1/KNR4 family protein [Streptomyces sp. 142MFCol3.1]